MEGSGNRRQAVERLYVNLYYEKDDDAGSAGSNGVGFYDGINRG